MEVICILNPAAGRGKAVMEWEKARKSLYEQGIETKTLVTTGPGDAVRLTKHTVSKGTEIIMVAGGDGTIGEVAGAVAGTDMKIAIVPCGTGNDLARSLGLPLTSDDYGQRFSSFVVRKIDLGVIDGGYFANAVGFGFDARVAYKANSRVGFLQGKIAYLAAVAICMWELTPVEVEIKVDGNVINKKVLLAAFANGPTVGGGLPIAPMAVLDDGFLDLVVLEAIPRLEFVKSFPLLLNGNHVNHPAVSLYRGKRFSLRSETRQYVHIDGEIQQKDRMELFIQPQSLNVLVPSK